MYFIFAFIVVLVLIVLLAVVVCAISSVSFGARILPQEKCKQVAFVGFLQNKKMMLQLNHSRCCISIFFYPVFPLKGIKMMTFIETISFKISARSVIKTRQ